MNPEPPASKPPQPNGTTQLLATLAQSGDKWIQFGILCLVGLSGLGNFFATQTAQLQNTAGQDRIRVEVREQIAEMHTWIQQNREWIKQSVDEFHKGNADSSENRKILEQFKEEIIGFEKRQLAMLNNQTEILNQLHAFVKQRQTDLEKNNP